MLPDHIISNDMKQDRAAVCSLLDAILSRVTVNLPTVKSFTLLSDNARCYQNDLWPAIGPFITKRHGLIMTH